MPAALTCHSQRHLRPRGQGWGGGGGAGILGASWVRWAAWGSRERLLAQGGGHGATAMQPGARGLCKCSASRAPGKPLAAHFAAVLVAARALAERQAGPGCFSTAKCTPAGPGSAAS